MIENKNKYTTPIEKLGKYKLIEILTEKIQIKNKSSVLGIGDDSGILKTKGNTLISSKILVENVNFNLSYVPMKHLGYKSIISSISNIISMNATPSQFSLSLAVSNKFPVEAIEDIYDGIKKASYTYNVDFINGDINSSNLGLIINITSIGEANKKDIIYRKGAKVNDLLVVSGDLGAAYFGLQILERENITFKSNPNFQPDLSQYVYLLERQLKPEARLDIIKLFKQLNLKPTSMIDISNGLASEILHLSKHSKVGFTIYEDKIPMDSSVINSAEEFGINPITGVLNGGEDYELLFTISNTDYNKIKNNPNFTIIGYATEEIKNVLITKDKTQEIKLNAQGWSAN